MIAVIIICLVIAPLICAAGIGITAMMKGK